VILDAPAHESTRTNGKMLERRDIDREAQRRWWWSRGSELGEKLGVRGECDARAHANRFELSLRSSIEAALAEELREELAIASDCFRRFDRELLPSATGGTESCAIPQLVLTLDATQGPRL
jgi:hypothetical protein